MGKPILFNTQMTKAILDGCKTQTRRIVKPQPIPCHDGEKECLSWPLCPYTVGDILYVRETWQDLSNNEGEYVYLADGDKGLGDKGWGVITTKDIKWRPSIHMPKEAARIFLKVTNVRVERLQDIAEEDARAEGFRVGDQPAGGNSSKASTARQAYMWTWQILYDKCDYPWASNPWVWAIEFERV
jgi:hypothetical protein